MRQGRTVLTALATTMAVILWYLILFGPQRADHRRLSEQLATAERQEQELRSTLARLRRLAAEQEARVAQLERLKRLVPPEADVARFILAANDAAVRSGVEWVSLAPSAPGAGTGGPFSVAVNIAVSGDFFTVLDYVRRLENLERLVVLDSLQLSSGATQAGGARQLRATLSARLFTTAPAAPAAGAEGATPAPVPAPPGSPAPGGAVGG